jgi:nitrogen fixation protein FixH
VQVNNSGSALRRRSWLWPGGIIALLCLHAVGMLVVVFIATRDPSFSVEPNSYRKAVAWDTSRARSQASETLGWTAAIKTQRAVDPLGRRRVTCELKDKQGLPVAAATVRLEIFHHARAADRQQVTLNPEDHGVYSALVPMKRTGTWEIRVNARRGDEVYSTVFTENVEGGA